MDDLTLSLTLIFVAAAAGVVLLSWRAAAPREAGHGEYHCAAAHAVLGMVVLAGATNLVTLFIGYELLSIPLYVLCATEMRRERSLESGLKYLIIGSVGSATLLYGLAFVYGATGATDFARSPPPWTRSRDDVLLLTGARADRRRARVQGLGGAVPPVDAGRLRGRADADHRVHGGGDEGGRVRGHDPALRRRADRRVGRLGAGARDARGGHDRRRQRRRDRAVVAEAAARLLVGRAGRLHARRRRGHDAARRARGRLLPGRLPVHEPGRVRGDRRARARDRRRRRHLVAVRAGRRPARCSRGR